MSKGFLKNKKVRRLRGELGLDILAACKKHESILLFFEGGKQMEYNEKTGELVEPPMHSDNYKNCNKKELKAIKDKLK